MHGLNEKQRFLVDVYYRLAEAFDEATNSILERHETASEKASMQAHMMAAVMNDFIQTLPGMTPAYLKQIVDYVFQCRAEVLGKGDAGLMPLPPITHPGTKDVN